MKKVLCLLLALTALVLCFSGCTSSGTGGTTGGDTGSQEKAGIGETVTSENWKITLLSAKTYDMIGSGYFENKPEEGKIYLALFFEVENISNEDSYFNYFYVQGYEDGYSTSIEIILGDVEGQEVLTGDVAAGKKMKGYLLWEVSSQWQELEMSYKDDLFSSKAAATFLVKASDIV